MKNILKKIKFKEKKTWLIVISFIYLIISIYYLGTLIYWDKFYDNVSIITDDMTKYFSSGRMFLIKMLSLWFVVSIGFFIGWVILKVTKNKIKPKQNNISPQS
ncbi:hypothetical protein [Spiroplasma endosymbiont of Melieria omissa]|uniref:hypothetical protein n=1 Tax=Spiroplasma endosymbiont of Melieria omissa TaxID=3139324 RepID=UPI003CCAF8DA